MTIGDILTAENYTQGAIWCNANNAHIELVDGQYIIAANPEVEPVPIDTAPTLEERVQTLEADNESMNDLLLGVIDIIDSLEA